MVTSITDLKMSKRLTLNLIEETDKEYIQNTLLPECYLMNDEYIDIPFAFAQTEFLLDDAEEPLSIPTVFKGSLRHEQHLVQTQVLTGLDKTFSFIISSKPGFGKTITAISIACKLGLKTVIVVNKLILINQWIDSISKFTKPNNVQYITSSTKYLNEDVQFYIVNAINVPKKSFWSTIKFVIVDELHQIITPKLSQSILTFHPKYILGLSATPYRFDEYDIAIEWFFGKDKVGQDLNTFHTVSIIDTNWHPSSIKYTRKGMDWNDILNQQSENKDRNHIITSNIVQYPNNTWLILVKRVAHALELQKIFKDVYGLQSATLVGNTITFDKNVKILIGTTSKIGVGFDHASIDALCVAADVKNYFVQFLGRCMRREDSNPIVLDFKDNFGPLRKHLEERISEYKSSGGIISE